MNHWIEAVFRAADAADPGAKLCYDDHNTDGLNAKSTGIFRLVESTGGYLHSRVRLVAPYGSSGYRPGLHRAGPAAVSSRGGSVVNADMSLPPVAWEGRRGEGKLRAGPVGDQHHQQVRATPLATRRPGGRSSVISSRR